MDPRMPALRISPFRRFSGIAGALGAVAAITAIDFKFAGINSATAAFSYLLLILGLATRVGFAESLAASLASMLCYNYFFLPPIGTFTIGEPQNWVALVAFLVTGITASQLSSSARTKAEEAKARQLELERLQEFTTALMIGDEERSIVSQIAKQTARVFELPAVAFYDAAADAVCLAGSGDFRILEKDLRHAVNSSHISRDIATEIAVAPVHLGGSTLGSLAVAGATTISDTALQAIAQAAAIAMERARTQEAAIRADAMRRHEELKSTLLDALAHEFKTPLTSIRAATTTLLARPGRGANDRELLTIADEEADRLARLVDEAIEATRVSSGEVHLHREPFAARELVSASLAELRAFCEGRQISVSVDADLPRLDIDPQLTSLALRQLLNNALKYAPPSSPIRIAAERRGDFVEFRVENDGPGIPMQEQKAIFEKFYRGRAARERIPGTGLGLTIARGIIEAHGGHITVESEAGKGVSFLFTLPAEKLT
jgi:two-component system, OmpR family, sensor histidine kinase KdpD